MHRISLLPLLCSPGAKTQPSGSKTAQNGGFLTMIWLIASLLLAFASGGIFGFLGGRCLKYACGCEQYPEKWVLCRDHGELYEDLLDGQITAQGH